MTESHQRKAYIELHIAVFLFGFTGILGRLIEMDATVLVWHRMWLTSIFMFFLVKLTKRWQRIPFKALIKIALISSTIAIHWVLFYASIKLAGVSVAMICLSSVTLFTALFEPIISRNKIQSIQLFFSALVIMGIYLMANEQQEQISGILVGVASAMFSALFTVFNKQILPFYKPRMLSFVEMSLGFLMLTIMLPAFDLFFPVTFSWPDLKDWIYLLILSLFCTVIAFNLSLNALTRLSAFTVNLAINLEPVYAIILAFALFNEYELLGPGFYAGSALILIAVLGESAIKRYKKKSLPDTSPGTQP